MKNLKYILVLLLITISCNEDELLEEQAFSFYTPDNSYTTPEQIDIAVVQLYENVSQMLYGSGANGDAFTFQYTTDVGYDAIAPNHELNSWGDQIRPEKRQISRFWNDFYQQIYDANVILNRINTIEYSSEEERNIKIGEAKFFRAFAYRGLVTIYGGVPLVLEETDSPKRDFRRASVADVWTQIISDLTEAAQFLPGADEVQQDGRMAKGAAYHLLAEAYIVTKEYQKAITAASEVIDNLGYALMRERFGTRSDEPGDVYWDLFRRGNQNRGSGNTEAIYVSQYEFLVPGGEINDNLARFLVPLYWQLKGNSDGENLFLGPTKKNGGRGIGWWAASDYMLNQVWEDAQNDIRNSEFNIIRDIVADNPESDYFGQKIVESGSFTEFDDPTKRWWSAIFAKSTPINNFPDQIVDNQANSSFRDRYVIRLAETYLLRAEAYFLNGDSDAAASDINEVRERSLATPITGGDVNMEFILDERARELFVEENRLMTLMRIGVIVDRVRTYNPMHNGQYASNPIFDYQNVWPIPNTEIERNTEATLEQNPGY
ncbi:RagB/SusD family nutrient uptake outer membrane protein [Pareuzebyella sediminis]|uniref:RagB/SusD family nutrient uptake outer membrane protein n=1 Tax=Pareuzebyella sediminis TaxID=2607998 RepID=UPI0018E15E23|nr:RagB/SusD family nutrient uptake outer membrane protein [Pareuzebyella sediminis]